jgi:hypothetical protein
MDDHARMRGLLAQLKLGMDFDRPPGQHVPSARSWNDIVDGTPSDDEDEQLSSYDSPSSSIHTLYPQRPAAAGYDADGVPIYVDDDTFFNPFTQSPLPTLNYWHRPLFDTDRSLDYDRGSDYDGTVSSASNTPSNWDDDDEASIPDNVPYDADSDDEEVIANNIRILRRAQLERENRFIDSVSGGTAPAA